MALAGALEGRAAILPLAPEVDLDSVARFRDIPLPEGTAVVLHTSGSSGVPKAVALSRDALLASAEATHDALGGPGQWLVTLPGHLISGLQMLVRSHLAGTTPVFTDGSFDARSVLELADTMTHERRYISVVPVQLARFIELAEIDPEAARQLRSFAAVLVGGQAVPLDVRQRAHELGVTLRRSYGMTETAGGCVYDGVPIGEAQVRIRGGEIQVAGPMLALGYVGDERLTGERFITQDEGERWYRTGDAGELLGGMLTVTGRLDRVIISGGTNVSLDEVERVVQTFAGWSSVVALEVPDPEWGERVGLVVETEPHAAPFTEVRDAIRARLGVAATPLWATEAVQLPRLAGGKPDIRSIREWIADLRRSFRTLR